MIELAVGLFALVSPGRLTAWLLAASLGALAVGAAVTVATSGGRPVPCGCFGERGGTLSWSHVVINSMLGVLCALAAVYGALGRTSALSPGATLGLAAAAIPAAAAWWWLYAQAGSSP